MSKLKTFFMVVSGVHWISRTKDVLTNTVRNAKDTAKVVSDSVQDTKAGEGRNNAKYSVYSHSKGRYFYADDFAEAMNKAYTKDEVARLERESRTMRRIHAHGATAVFVVSIVAAFWLKSFLPLFAIAPALPLGAFALRRGCFEETYKHLKLVGLHEYLSSPGIWGLWR